MRKCKKCGRYTLKLDKCPHCNGELTVPSPAKFSLEDRYLKMKLEAIIKGRKSDSQALN